MIIKKLEENYKFVQLGVTSVESAIHPPQFMCTEEQLFEAAALGHACGSIIQHTALDSLSGGYTNQLYCDMLKYLENSPSQKSRTFYKNLLAGNIVTIGQRYKGVTYCETPMYYRIEAGKYLIMLKSGGIDMGGLSDEDGIKVLYDNKLYSSFFKDGDNNFMGTKYTNNDKEQEIKTKAYDGKVYTVDETLRSDLGEKIQRWMYPIMHGFGDKDYIYFQYNVVVKNAAKEKNLMPNVQEIRIKIYKHEAEKLLKETIVEVFTNHFDKVKCELIKKPLILKRA